MAKWRKKPVVVEADVYSKGMEDGFMVIGEAIINGLNSASYVTPKCLNFDGVPYIKTLEGNHFISDGDYIITGVEGERYPCKASVFERTYELV